ncbi:MAG: universal stress protein [Sphingomonadales bacterium]|nr:universal stress protein [Sphingomonadales bacterium]
MIKDMLAIVEDADIAAPFLKAVSEMAEAKGAYLEVVALTPAPLIAPEIAPLGGLYLPDDVLKDDDMANVERVRAHLRDARCDYDVIGLHNDVAWLAGDVRRTRQVADLFVVDVEEGWRTAWLRSRVIETLIHSAGTPILILPGGRPLPPVQRIVLGWKPSPEATRALHDLALLAEPGAAVEVVTVGKRLDECENERDTHAEVKRHLSRHGFAAEGHWIVNDEKIEAETLTIYAQETKADLLVIGGFSHSRIRQIVLGGVTHDLVGHTELPVLISG